MIFYLAEEAWHLDGCDVPPGETLGGTFSPGSPEPGEPPEIPEEAEGYPVHPPCRSRALAALDDPPPGTYDKENE